MKTVLFSLAIALIIVIGCKSSNTSATRPVDPISQQEETAVIFSEVHNEIAPFNTKEMSSSVVYGFKAQAIGKTYYIKKDGNKVFQLDATDPREITWASSVAVPAQMTEDTETEYAIRDSEMRTITFYGIIRQKKEDLRNKTFVQAF